MACSSSDMRPLNFASGPALLPQEVLSRAREEMLDWRGSGMSVLEMPFSSPEYQAIVDEAVTDLRQLLALPGNYRVLFLQGGAYAHFALVAMNLLGRRRHADYVVTGLWSARAANEARRYGNIRIAASNAASGFDRVPRQEAWRLDPGAAYCHITTNETANGLQFHWTPETGDVPLVADMTSDFLSRPIAVTRYGLLYASAQKNVGCAGLTIVIIRDDLLDRALEHTPSVFNYGLQAGCDGRMNTPPVFGVYIAGLMFAWIKQRGGLDIVARDNERKSARLYATIDANAFYRCPVMTGDRSLINVCFRLPTPDLETEFLRQAREQGLLHLEGHHTVGGIRASLYNAMPEEGVDVLIDFMETFAARHRDVARSHRMRGSAHHA